jgi:uncharacterized protein (DUF2267 family)
MSALGLKVIDETVQLTHVWLNELLDLTGWTNKQRAYRLLRVTLHALRDRLPFIEAVHLGAEMPLLIRGMYFEGWHPAGKPEKFRSREEFLARVQSAFELDPLENPEEAVSAVLALLTNRISRGEMADVRHAMPRSIADLFGR